MTELTVLGIGNILRRDEGVGVHLLEAVRTARGWPAHVKFVDGGAGGLNLLGVIEGAGRLVVFDAAEMDLPPGRWRVISPDQIADADDQHRLSMHEAPFIETLRLCREFLAAPEEVTILAIQPASMDAGTALSDRLAGVFDELTLAGVELIEALLSKTTPPEERKQ